MAMELERQIMYEIGFWGHYTSFNGTTTCKPIRIEAARRLPEILDKYHKAKEEIDKPNSQIMKTFAQIAQTSDKEDWVLAKTWQAAGEIIAAHIHFSRKSKTEKAEAYRSFQEYLVKNYLR